MDVTPQQLSGHTVICILTTGINTEPCGLAAGYTMTARKRSRSSSPSAHQSPHGTAAVAAATAAAEAIPATQQLDGSSEPSRVQQQLDALGACHVGYGHLQMPDRQVSIVGARPFSKVTYCMCQP